MYLRGLWARPVFFFHPDKCGQSARGFQGCLSRFRREDRAASAVEFALIATPFLFLILAILQLSVFYMAQSSLNAGVVATANSLRSGFTSTTPSFPNAAALKAQVVSGSGGLIHNDSTLAVEIRQLVNLDASLVPISDGTNDYGTTTSVLVIRSQSKVITFAPGFGSLANVRSSAIVRRQGT
jgi:Flp pilus assembly protein TadG